MVREFASSYKVTTTSEVADQLGTTVPEGFRLRIKNMEKNFFIGRFTRAGRLINYVVNNSAEKIAPDFLLEGKKFGSIQVYNPEDGSITQHKMPCAISIKPYSSLFLVEYP
jgi:hypothetical protein